jgi:hypothetical protein
MNWTDIIAKVAAPLLAALLGGCIHLWQRVTKLETVIDRMAEDHRENIVEARDLDKTMTSITLLVTKVDTLLEVSMRRLDMLERQVFKV